MSTKVYKYKIRYCHVDNGRTKEWITYAVDEDEAVANYFQTFLHTEGYMFLDCNLDRVVGFQ